MIFKSPNIYSSLYRIAKEEIIKTNPINNKYIQSNKKIIIPYILEYNPHIFLQFQRSKKSDAD